MKVSLNWLREFTALPPDTGGLVDLLTLAGIEVEGVHHHGADIPGVVVAQILESSQHPNADRLSVCRVDDGTGAPLQIVCGAKNYRVGDKAPLARPGAVLPGDFRIKIGKLRGVDSHGMLCSAAELGLGEGEDGLLILPAGALVGTPISELFPADVILELEITPNRPDLLSHFGIAREIAALSNTRGGLIEPKGMSSPTVPGAGIRIHEPTLCPFYSAQRVRGVKVGPSPDWLRTRLESVGVRAINNIVDVTNFVMLEMGQPLHAFDEARLAGGEIHVRAAATGEIFQALDGKTYALTPADLVVADAQAAAAIAGVMGGELSSVTGSTVDILIESALFNPQTVRRTSRRLGLGSDSSYRFERGIDPDGVLVASQRATELILELAGGTVAGAIEIAGAIPVVSRTVSLRPERCRAILGVEIPGEQVDSILAGFHLEKQPDGSWLIPSFRQDLTREADLIEEVSRAFGIENIPGTLRSRPAPASLADAAHDEQMELRRRLTGQGFFEARTFSLISERAASAQEPAGPAGPLLAIRNPLIEDQAVLRPSLLPGLLGALERNLRGGQRSIRIFELGRVFPDGTERLSLAGLLTGDSIPASWGEPAPRQTGLFDLKGGIEALGLEGLDFEPGAVDGLLPAVRITVNGQAAGLLGQLAPARLRALDCQAPVSVFELDLSRCRLRPIPSNIAPIPRFPAVTRDIAIIADAILPHTRVREVIESANEQLLARIQLFDLYSDPEGIRLPAGKKSLAYSLTYRAPDRTLTAEEVNAAHIRLKERLKAALSVSFRE